MILAERCPVCGDEYKSVPSRRKKYCSRYCAGYDRRGNNNSQWGGDRIIHINGYIYCWQPHHPLAMNNRVFEHRLVMENHIGRFLTKEEIVHHINGIKADNRIENLSITNLPDHTSSHHTKHPIINSKRVCPKCTKEQSITNYHKRKKGRLGIQNICKYCCEEYRQSRTRTK